MCGIVGVVLKEGNDKPLVNQMTSLLHHRGPDEQSSYFNNRVSLGFSRLSIIDPLGGHQPIFNEDKSIVAICNGEIYNHNIERIKLENLNHFFNSGSDAEIIPHLYEEYGDNFVNHLHGMFAIILFDQSKNRLIVARDALGIKPLYYLDTERGIYFSSEVKCFLLVPEYNPDVDPCALDHLLTFKHIPGQPCLLKGVRTILPGHKMVYDIKENCYHITKYYQLPRKSNSSLSVNWEEAKTEVCRLFDEAVKIRLMSDVPLGVALSGGIDSSAVVASVAKQLDVPPKTFTVYVGDTINEFDYARKVAERYRTDHHEFLLDPMELQTLIPKVIWHIEEPISVAELSTYYLGMAVKDHVKVLLCGEGSDELFGGYLRFQPLNMFSMLPNSLIKWGYVRGMNGFTYSQRRKLYSSNMKTFLGSNDNKYLNFILAGKRNSLLNRILYYELTQQLPRHQLMRLDKLTMAHSVEARVPFLDTNLISYVARLPSQFKVRLLREKVLLKLAMSDRLPEEVINRRKYGFSNPTKALFQGSFRDICHTELQDNKRILSKYFSYPAIERLFSSLGNRLLSKPDQKLFHIYLFLKWHQIFIEKKFLNKF